MDLELRGIPAHLWKIETVESILYGLCLIQDIHPSSFDDNNRAVFKLRAWCPVPAMLPSFVDLHVEESPVVFEVDSSYPRSLIYPIAVLASCVDVRPEIETNLSPPTLPDHSDDDCDIVQRKRRHANRDLTGRASVKSRLGPRVSFNVGKGGPVDSLTLPALDAEHTAPGMRLLLAASLMDDSSRSAALAPPHACLNEDVSFGASVNALRFINKGDPVDCLALPCASDVELTAPGLRPLFSDSLMVGSWVLSDCRLLWRPPPRACFSAADSFGATVNALARMTTEAGLLMTSDFTQMTPRVVSLRHSSIMWDVPTSGSSVSAMVPTVLAPPLANSNVADRLEPSDIGDAHGPSSSVRMVSGLAQESTSTSSALIQLGCKPDNRAVMATGNSLPLPKVVSLQDGEPCPALVQQPCKALQVYSRRKHLKQSCLASEEEGVALEFFNKIVKPLSNVLPVPSSPKLKARKSIPPNFVPRRSRRVAKLPPLAGNSAAHTICLKLGLKNGQAPVSTDDLECCAREFNKPLSVSLVKALATLFRWEIPEEELLVRPADGLLQVS
jgi:hypothetical protein